MSNIIEEILREKLIVIVRGVKGECLEPLCEALYAGGAKFVEFTYGSPTMKDDTETAYWIGYIAKQFKDRMTVGAGTVTTTRQVERTYNAGGRFVISPNTDPEIIGLTKQFGLVSIPGALTPSEIVTADHAGADFVKLFPISTMGADYVKAIKAPLRNVRMLAVGGVNDTNMPDYFKAGVCGIGLGSNIINMKLIEAGDYDGVTELTKKYVEKLKEF